MLGDYWHDQNNGYTPSINLKNISNYLNNYNIKLGVTINPKYEIKEGSNDYRLISNYIKTNKFSFIPFSNDKIGLYFNLFINNLEKVWV